MSEDRLITVAIYTYEKAQIVKSLLESEGIPVVIQNVNLIQPVISSGVRVRIKETDLPHALTILEAHNTLFETPDSGKTKKGGDSRQHIVIPVDFSDYSYKACSIGFDIAHKIDATVTVLHTYVIPYLPDAIPITDTFIGREEMEEFKSIKENAHKQMGEFFDKLKASIAAGELPDINFECSVKEGVPEDEIRIMSRRVAPSLIVMGTRGKGEKEMDLIGSVTAEIIDRSPVFVYAIPKNAQKKNFDEIHKVAFFTSFDQRDLIAFDSLITTFKDYHFEVSFIHLSDNAQKRTWNEIRLVGIQEYFKKQYPQLTIDYDMLGGESLLSNLDEYVKEKGIDVLCLSNYKRNVFARLFNPSIARRMIFHSNTPILVIK